MLMRFMKQSHPVSGGTRMNRSTECVRPFSQAGGKKGKVWLCNFGEHIIVLRVVVSCPVANKLISRMKADKTTCTTCTCTPEPSLRSYLNYLLVVFSFRVSVDDPRNNPFIALNTHIMKLIALIKAAQMKFPPEYESEDP